MKYETARELVESALEQLDEAPRRSSRILSARAKEIYDRYDKDLASGKHTSEMLDSIRKHHKDATDKSHEEYTLAQKNKKNKIRYDHHMARMKHYMTHIGNYEKHYRNAADAHNKGDYRRAAAEGSHAATGPHLRDVPHHVDYHVASYYDKK